MKHNTTTNSSKAANLAVIAYTIIIIIFGGTSFTITRDLVKLNTRMEQVTNRYEDLVYENEILWTYVENIDTFKTLEDAISARDRIYSQIQFIDE